MLATLNRASSELSSHQRKTFKVDDHLGIAMSGIISDGRSLCRYMRNECLNHRSAWGPCQCIVRPAIATPWHLDTCSKEDTLQWQRHLRRQRTALGKGSPMMQAHHSPGPCRAAVPECGVSAAPAAYLSNAASSSMPETRILGCALSVTHFT